MDMETYTRFVVALLAVLALIGAIAWLAKRFGLGGRMVANRSRSRRLAVAEVMALDARRRLVLVQRDGAQHLLLLGPTGDLLIERDIEAPESAEGAPMTSNDGDPRKGLRA